MKTILIALIFIVLISFTFGYIDNEINNKTIHKNLIQNSGPNDTFDNYYNWNCSNIINDDIYNYLKNYQWHENNQYEEGKFDCSQMSTYMEWLLECNGYNTIICEGIINSTYHAWILIEIDNNWIAYECTSCCWVSESESPSHYIPDRTYNDIYDIYNYYQDSNSEKAFINEEKWW